uniref:Uncharacterized protein n=1 Tax=Anguilla anguilla TaxID=7936 RepID=A0A0E9W8F3_ANGAN
MGCWFISYNFSYLNYILCHSNLYVLNYILISFPVGLCGNGNHALFLSCCMFTPTVTSICYILSVFSHLFLCFIICSFMFVILCPFLCLSGHRDCGFLSRERITISCYRLWC